MVVLIPRLLLLVLVAGLGGQVSALYHTSSEVLHWFSHCAVKRPDTLRFREMHEKHTNTAVPVATISTGINSPNYKPKPAVLFVFGEHAREVITPEVGIWLARMLINANSSVYSWPELSAAFERAGVDASGRSLNSSRRTSPDPAASSGSSSSSTVAERGQGAAKQDWHVIARSWVQQLLREFEVVIVPIEALDSRRLVESGQLCVRKSASNVDLNRNWPYAWKKEAATDEQYGGPMPFSEPQSRLMKHLMDHLTGRLLGYVNVHSGEWALYTPWDSKQAYGPGLPRDLPDLVSKVGRLCDCQAGPAGAVSGYLAFGTSMDYLYVQKRVPYPLTVEVYGGDNAGKLTGGTRNKELTTWPTVNKAGAPIAASAQFQRRRLLEQQQQQEQEVMRIDGAGAPRRSLLAVLRSLLQGQAPELSTEQQQQRLHRRRRHRRRSRLQHSRGSAAAAETGADTQLPLLPNVDGDGDLVAVNSAAGVLTPAAAAGGFSAGGGNLEQVRQLAKQQLLQQQQQPGSDVASSIPTHPVSGQAAQAASDALLATVAAAPAMEQQCFKAFNPETEAEYRRVVADWLAASVIMLKHMADGKEGRDMVAQVASAPARFSRGSSRAQRNGISVQEPRPTSSGSTRDLLSSQC